jgi:signal transduction histidine kinase
MNQKRTQPIPWQLPQTRSGGGVTFDASNGLWFSLLEMNFDANLMLKALGESFVPLVLHAGQTISVNMPAGQVIITADQNRISQTISNLLSNATKYAGEGAHIKLESIVTDSVFSVYVTDNGIGMDSEAAENATTPAVSGLGLGLNISQTIIRMHDGEITTSSEIGKGIRIGFEIPRVVNDINQAA